MKKELITKDEMLEQAHQQIITLEEQNDELENCKLNSKSNGMPMEDFTRNEAENLINNQMPKEMSEWFDSNITNGNAAIVNGYGKKGYAIKSRDCTVIIVPRWNYNEQFSNIVNDLRERGEPRRERQRVSF